MKIIYGPKGTGKTKTILDSANKVLDSAKGHVIFVTDTTRYTYDLNNQIRYLDVNGFDIVCEGGFRGFIKGLVAASGDNEYIFIDGLKRIIGDGLRGGKALFKYIRQIKKA